MIVSVVILYGNMINMDMIVIVLVPIRNLYVLHNAPTVDLPLLSYTRKFCQGHVIDLLNCKEQFVPYGLLPSYYIYKSLVFPCAMMFSRWTVVCWYLFCKDIITMVFIYYI